MLFFGVIERKEVKGSRIQGLEESGSSEAIKTQYPISSREYPMSKENRLTYTWILDLDIGRWILNHGIRPKD